MSEPLMALPTHEWFVCETCKRYEFGRKGWYLCLNAHVLCRKCHPKTKGRCGACKAVTEYRNKKLPSPWDPPSRPQREDFCYFFHDDDDYGQPKGYFGESDEELLELSNMQYDRSRVYVPVKRAPEQANDNCTSTSAEATITSITNIDNADIERNVETPDSTKGQ